MLPSLRGRTPLVLKYLSPAVLKYLSRACMFALRRPRPPRPQIVVLAHALVTWWYARGTVVVEEYIM